MSTTIAINSQERMESIVRKEFDQYKQPWQIADAKEVIQTAKDWKMREAFIEELKNDLY